MFCPKCGKPLRDDGDNYFCSEGDMQLSIDMTKRLRECFQLKQRKPQLRPLRNGWGKGWYCPGCGVQAQQQNGSVICPRCQLPLDEFLNHLIELHPHKETLGYSHKFKSGIFLKARWTLKRFIKYILE